MACSPTTAQRARLAGALRRQTAQVAYEETVEATLDRLAAHLEAHVDVDRLLTHIAVSAASTNTMAMSSPSARP